MKADHGSTLRLLKTARGQLDGIAKMIEDDRYCIEISTQLMACESLLSRINADVLKAHVETCVVTAMQTGTEQEQKEKLSEIDRLIDKLAKR